MNNEVEGSDGPITLSEIMVDETTRRDTAGNYTIYFRLSDRPSERWVNAFRQKWHSPPRSTSRHDSRIANIKAGEQRLALGPTTIEEVERFHLATLKLVIDGTNTDVQREITRENNENARREAEEQMHFEHVRAVASRLKLD